MKDRVHIVTMFWDCPRAGIADFEGRLHHFENEFDREADDYSDWFCLTPVSGTTLQAAIEMDNIYLRWFLAFHAGETTADWPALPHERAKFDELKSAVTQSLQDARQRSVRVRGRITWVQPPNWSPAWQGPRQRICSRVDNSVAAQEVRRAMRSLQQWSCVTRRLWPGRRRRHKLLA